MKLPAYSALAVEDLYCRFSVESESYFPAIAKVQTALGYLIIEIGYTYAMSEHQYIIEEQLEKLRDAAHKTNDGRPLGRKLRDEVLATMLFDTGLRAREALSVKPDGMIRLDDDELVLPGDLQKDYPTDSSPSTATLELDRSGVGLTRLLRNYLSSDWYQDQDSPYLFPSRQSDSISHESVNNILRRLAREADVRPYRTDGERGDPSDLTAHDFRHSVANWMLADDSNRLIDVRNRLRHQSIQTTERVYEHFVRR